MDPLHRPQISTWTQAHLDLWGKLTCSPCQVAKIHLIQTWQELTPNVAAEGYHIAHHTRSRYVGR